MAGELRAGVGALPLVLVAPLQAPEALQWVALAEVQVSVAVPPPATAAGLALKVTVGSTFTVTDEAALEPPGPVQTIE